MRQSSCLCALWPGCGLVIRSSLGQSPQVQCCLCTGLKTHYYYYYHYYLLLLIMFLNTMFHVVMGRFQLNPNFESPLFSVFTVVLFNCVYYFIIKYSRLWLWTIYWQLFLWYLEHVGYLLFCRACSWISPGGFAPHTRPYEPRGCAQWSGCFRVAPQLPAVDTEHSSK